MSSIAAKREVGQWLEFALMVFLDRRRTEPDLGGPISASVKGPDGITWYLTAHFGGVVSGGAACPPGFLCDSSSNL